MRIARVQTEDGPRAGVVEGEVVRVLAAEVDVLDLLGAERDGSPAGSSAKPDDALLAPIEPPTIRDFSVFEQHIEGAIKTSAARRDGPGGLVREPDLLLLEPARDHRARRGHRAAAGLRRLDLELEVAASSVARARTCARSRPRAHRRLHDLQRLVRARHRSAECSIGLGLCKAKDFANTLGPWIVTPTSSSVPRGDRSTSHERPSTARARSRHAREHGLELRGAGRLRVARDVGPAGRRARLRHLRRRLPVRALGPAPGAGPAARSGPATRFAWRRGDRRAHQPPGRGLRSRPAESPPCPYPGAGMSFALGTFADAERIVCRARRRRARHVLGPPSRTRSRCCRTGTAAAGLPSWPTPPPRASPVGTCGRRPPRPRARSYAPARTITVTCARCASHSSADGDQGRRRSCGPRRSRRVQPLARRASVRLRGAARRAIRRLRRRRPLRARAQSTTGNSSSPSSLVAGRRGAPSARCPRRRLHDRQRHQHPRRDVPPRLPDDRLRCHQVRRRSCRPARTSCRRSSSPTRATAITLRVNGDVMQDEATSDIIFGVEQLVDYASRISCSAPATCCSPARRRVTPRTTASAGCGPVTWWRARSPASASSATAASDEATFTA